MFIFIRFNNVQKLQLFFVIFNVVNILLFISFESCGTNINVYQTLNKNILLTKRKLLFNKISIKIKNHLG